jgi:hypothetical protein
MRIFMSRVSANYFRSDAVFTRPTCLTFVTASLVCFTYTDFRTCARISYMRY